MAEWLGDSLNEIARRRNKPPAWPPPIAKKPAKPAMAAKPKARPTLAAPAAPPLPDLPRIEADFTTTVDFANTDAIRVTGASPDPDWFRLRGELTQLGCSKASTNCLPAAAARRGNALVPNRNCAQGAEAVSRSGIARRRSGPRQKRSKPAWR